MSHPIPQAKVVFLGESGTGKTSIITRYIDNDFTGNSQPTVGGSGRPVRVQDRDRQLDLVIWDTAGQERYRGLTPMYYRGAIAAVIVFDVTNRESFDQVQGWINELQNTSSNTVILLCGNKVDLGDARTIGEVEAGIFAESARTPYCETSAKTGSGVRLLFQEIAHTIVEVRAELLEQKSQIPKEKPTLAVKNEESCC
jgi:small GTP-binding protein